MMSINGNPKQIPPRPYTISKDIFRALSPLEQLAALALEKVGKVQIVEENELEILG